MSCFWKAILGEAHSALHQKHIKKAADCNIYSNVLQSSSAIQQMSLPSPASTFKNDDVKKPSTLWQLNSECITTSLLICISSLAINFEYERDGPYLALRCKLRIWEKRSWAYVQMPFLTIFIETCVPFSPFICKRHHSLLGFHKFDIC